MVGFIYKVLETIYGGGLADKVSNWMTKVWATMTTIFTNNDLIGSAYSVFSGVAASLLVLYFYMEIASQASRELLTLEKLVIFCIKFIVAFMILLNSKGIMNGLMTFGEEIYKKVDTVQIASSSEEDHSWDTFIANNPGNDEKGRNIKIMEELEKNYKGGVSEFLDALGAVMIGAIGMLIAFVCQLLCYLICTTNALNICVRGFMAPLAIPQLFEEGQRSAGVRYFKSFIATCLEMAVILITLRLASELSLQLQPVIFGVVTGSTPDGASQGTGWLFSGGEMNIQNVDFALSILGLVPSLLPLLAATGAIGGVAKITHDIVG